MEAFLELCPEPVAPGKLTPDGFQADLKNPDFVSSMTEFNRRRLAYMVINSLAPSNIEWETVDFDVPGTWANWETDLRNNGFSQIECNRILQLVLEANQLDEGKLKKARDAFLHGLQPASTK
jgi:hypothetical protein